MLVKDIFIELRERLRCCNVYIITNVDFKKDCNLKVSIQSDCIVLNYYDNEDYRRRDSLSSIESLSESEDDNVTCTIPIQEFCSIIPNSMSCLKVDKNTITFRILTEAKNGGNFYKELLAPLKENRIELNKLIINLNSGDEVKILCANCQNVVSNGFIKFDRVLELPTSNLDMSEWFCHGHGHTSNMLKPSKLDFLYRLTFFVINNNHLSEKTNKFNQKRSVYHCNRCLAWLGSKEKNNVKLYNSEVKIQHGTVTKHVFKHVFSTTDISTDDFIYTIECMTKEFNLGLQYTMMCKIVLECAVTATTKQYLLIWIMDKDLEVLRNSDIIDTNTIELHSSRLTKLLYKIEPCLNDEVETWLTDPSVVNTDISKSMFCNGLKHLENMSLKVPESFRFTNGYSVSYLNV
ncbi:uncharacterized protein LOC121737975 [Aricia agestis]|uniref:uncharacterized protein LOC121737975 n=1 Tax=Aricia agestis TaxID=91739 RepID=UPI001C208F15|nr:uncharacterized protein LOC121737975 [Aricia agestis]